MPFPWCCLYKVQYQQESSKHCFWCGLTEADKKKKLQQTKLQTLPTTEQTPPLVLVAVEMTNGNILLLPQWHSIYISNTWMAVIKLGKIHYSHLWSFPLEQDIALGIMLPLGSGGQHYQCQDKTLDHFNDNNIVWRRVNFAISHQIGC